MEKLTAHTPGPWTVHNFGDDSWEILTETDSVAEVQDNLDNPGRSEADARLIAAAPALEEALASIVGHFPANYDKWPSGVMVDGNKLQAALAALALTAAPTAVKA